MKKVRKSKTIPEYSIISDGFDKIDYCDSYWVNISTEESIDALLNKVFIIPRWVMFLIKIRNFIVKAFGLRTGELEGKKIQMEFYPIGKRAIYFMVVNRNENEIVMQENDFHLNFRTSLLAIRGETETQVCFTTLVKFNNVWGKIYFAPVGFFHQKIMVILMKQLFKNK